MAKRPALVNSELAAPLRPFTMLHTLSNVSSVTEGTSSVFEFLDNFQGRELI